MKIIKKSITLIIVLLGLTSSLDACRWCFPGRVRSLIAEHMVIVEQENPFADAPLSLSELVDEQRDEANTQMHENREDGLQAHDEAIKSDEACSDHSEEKEKIMPFGLHAPSEQGAEFYDECVFTYYPKVNVIKEIYFPTMCPTAIDVALQEVVKVLAHDTWFYFTNDKQQFRWGAYWERIIGISKIFKQFITQAIILKSGGVVEMGYYDRYLAEKDGIDMSQTIELIEYWKDYGFTAYQDFFALYFDYRLKIFNEGIKFEKRNKIYHNYNPYYYTKGI